MHTNTHFFRKQSGVWGRTGNGSYSPQQTYNRWLKDYHGPYAVHKAMEDAYKFGQTFERFDVALAVWL